MGVLRLKKKCSRCWTPSPRRMVSCKAQERELESFWWLHWRWVFSGVMPPSPLELALIWPRYPLYKDASGERPPCGRSAQVPRPPTSQFDDHDSAEERLDVRGPTYQRSFRTTTVSFPPTAVKHVLARTLLSGHARSLRSRTARPSACRICSVQTEAWYL
jgi:hypothetical protein